MKHILLYILLSFAVFAKANNTTSDHYFNTLDTRDGLSHNTVNSILQDRDGFMWFGTKDGLNRYDGLNFRVYNKSNSGLKNNFITVLFEDNDGDIWVGTDAGVYVYHPKQDNFDGFLNKTEKGEVIERSITSILSDENNNIWISADDQGLFKYSRENNSLVNMGMEIHKSLGRHNITKFWLDKNVCWFSLYDNNLYYTKDGFKSFSQYKDKDGKETFRDVIVNSKISGPHNCWYIGTSMGLVEINRTTGEARKLLDSYVRDLQFRNNKELWIGTETGLFIYNIDTGNFFHYTSSKTIDPYSLSDNAIYSIYKDNEGSMWIGSYFGGLNYYPLQLSSFEKFYIGERYPNMGRRVREFCKGDDETLWFGTEDEGLFNYNPLTKTVTPFKSEVIGHNIHGLCLDGEYLWVGTFGNGLNRINLHTKQIKHYERGTQQGSLPSSNAFCVYKTTGGDIFVGTTLGLFIYDRKNDSFNKVNELKTIFVYNILEDSKGNLWLATYSNGVFRYDISTKKWKNFVNHKDKPNSLPYNKVISLFQDSKNRIWLMTQGAGFCRFNPSNETFVRYDKLKGFPSNIVYKMVEDSKGFLWLTTNQGLIRFDADKNNFRVYTTANGLLSNQFNYQSGYIDKKGYIYMGTTNGFIRFNPLSFVENVLIPPIVLTDFYVFNKRVYPGVKDSPLKQSIVNTDTIELNYLQNSFSLHAAALSFISPEKNQLLYKLEGFDHEWLAVSNNSLINYSNLPSGTYRLRIKGSNSDGVWNPKEKVLIIHITPPFYKSILAYIIYSLCLIGITVYLFSYFHIRSVRKHQMVMKEFERLKEKELYTAKIDFFTNVAHEIRTPLTLIKSPLENILSLKDLSAAIRDDLSIMRMNTNRLLDLVNQLLDFRKTETKGFNVNYESCDITDLLKKTYTRFSQLAREKNINFTLKSEGEIIATVDKELVTKIISNMFNNAIKYTGSFIDVKYYIEDSILFIIVSNDGKVIPISMREEVFRPFIQYKDGMQSHIPGTGLGLALSRSLAELQGGTLKMKDDDKLNIFVLSLPVKHDNVIKIEQTNDSEQSEANSDNVLKTDKHSRYTLLIVEDNKEMQAYISKLLISEYNIFTADNGQEALNILYDNQVSLILSDIMMPVMDGLELCDKVKSDLTYSHIPIILLTAKTTLNSKIDGLRSGADAYVEKPFSNEYLKVVISNLLENREKMHKAFYNSPFLQIDSMTLSKADESFMKSLSDIMEKNMQNTEFNIDDMASQLNMSRSSLNRKFKGLLDLTPNDYIRIERLKKAALLLKEGECKVNEVCYMVGFNTPSYFAKCFQKQYGMLPRDFVKGQMQ